MDTDADLGGDAGTILRQLRILQHGYAIHPGLRARWRQCQVHIIRWRLRKLLGP